VFRTPPIHLVVLFTTSLVLPSPPVRGEEPKPSTSAVERSRQDLIAKIRPSVVTLRVEGRDGSQRGLGTGFVVDEAGLIATNFHVIGQGRPFTVETPAGTTLEVLAVEASEVSSDLALIRVDPDGQSLDALPMAPPETAEQGLRVLAFGNPLGLENSVVEGIVSATRELEGDPVLQLAMPIEPGNSGGPLVDLEGRVHGIVNMKSAIDDNLGFAIPIARLETLLEQPNPVSIDRWIRLGKIDESRWTPVMGQVWQQRGSRLLARGSGDGFGGRALLLSQTELPEPPFEIGVMVRLDDEAGAAGLVFHSDGGNRHYGFYPSGGRLRLTCFRGPSVFSWQILEEIQSDHYLTGQWNHLKVRVEPHRIQCFVNDHLVITSSDQQLTEGQAGLAKFRDTEPEFRRFQIAKTLPRETLSESAQATMEQLRVSDLQLDKIGRQAIEQLGQSPRTASRELIRRSIELEEQAKRLRALAGDVRRAATLRRLRALDAEPEGQRLLTGTLLIAALDDPDLDLEAYRRRVGTMAGEIRDTLGESDDPVEKREALHRYLFQQQGFHGSRNEYYHPANSHLSRVIDDREGLPITLSILYIELGRRLGIDVEGVGLPGHFVVRHAIDAGQSQLVDVFERGKLLGRRDAAMLVAMHAGRMLDDDDLQADTTVEILTRVLNNLMGLAARNEDPEAMLRYAQAMVAINPERPQLRLMRAQLQGATGRVHLALQDVEQLLRQAPPQLDRGAAEQLRDALLEKIGRGD
jgi:regulator of sirC expression with transglutaminase-like and TPR domain